MNLLDKQIVWKRIQKISFRFFLLGRIICPSLGSVVIKVKECRISPYGRFHVSHSPGNRDGVAARQAKIHRHFFARLAEGLVKAVGQNQTLTLAEEMVVRALLRQRLCWA